MAVTQIMAVTFEVITEVFEDSDRLKHGAVSFGEFLPTF